MNNKGKFIGKKKITSTEETKDKTEGGFTIIRVEYEDESIEYLSSLMFPKVVSDKACDESQLRDKRIYPVVENILGLLKAWGIKTGELQYMSSLLNLSLDNSQKEAMSELWAKWMPRPMSLDDVDLITIDRVLKSSPLKLPYEKKEGA